MRQTILNNLNKLISGSINTIKISYRTPNFHDVMKFEMLGHKILEDNGMITVYDDKDNQSIPKTVKIDPLAVESVTYEDDQDDSLGIYERSVVVKMIDGSQIDFGTVGMG